MKAKLPIQKHFSLLTHFALMCGFVIAVTCAGPNGVAQENHEHHRYHKIYKVDVNGPASRPLLNLLSRHYSIVDFDKLAPSFELRPIVVGPDALAKQDVTAYLVRAYRAGLTVAIVYATQQQANLFDELVEGELAASCLPVPGAPRIALYAVQKTTREQPEEVSRYCLPVFQARAHSDESDVQSLAGQNDERSGETEEQWLDAAFAPQAPPPPLQSDDDASASSVNLDDLSRKTHCSEFYQNANGQVQDDHFITSLRNFDAQRDYYYLQNFPQIKSYRPVVSFQTLTFQPLLRQPGRDRPLIGTRLLFSEPATTTQYVSEYTNSRSTTVSASVGYSGGFPEVSTSVSVSVGKSTTVNVPPVTILNQSDLESGNAMWTFRPANPQTNVLYSPAVSWVWYIDRDVYGTSPNNLPEIFTNYRAGTTDINVAAVCGFPAPFPTFTVGPPVITSVDPPTAQRGGGTFEIRGTQMYPGIIRNVLLGGDALSPANFIPINDTEIRVVIPSNQRTGQNPVQVNTSFNGTILPSNTNIEVNVK